MGTSKKSIKQRNVFLWGVFGALIIFDLVNELLGLKIPWLPLVIVLIPIVLLICHSVWTLGWRRALLFVMLAISIGGISEYLGLKYGVLFGGRYQYHLSGIYLFSVPWSVLLYWAVFIYTGYHVSNAFLYWLRQEKPNYLNKNRLLPFVVFCDGVVVTSIDLLLDPIQVHQGSWTWLDKGKYLNIPIGNFLGWFIVAVLVTGIFRLVEYYRPRLQSNDIKVMSIMPTVGYGLLGIILMITAVLEDLLLVTFVGFITVIPIFLTNMYLYYSNNKRFR